MDMLQKIRPVWAEINLDYLAHNMKNIKNLTEPGTLIMPALKADGYGHGAAGVAQTMLDNGADRFAVAILEEGIELRKAGITVPILVLGYTAPERAEEAIRYRIALCMYRLADAIEFSKAAVECGENAYFHIKIDSGMGRIGYSVQEDSVQEIIAISKLQNVILEGVFTHFSTADEPDKTFLARQHEKFQWICKRLEGENVRLGLHHCANSAAILAYSAYQEDMVRPGIILYGIKPAEEMQFKNSFYPVMSLKCKVTHVKNIGAGESVGYGRKFIAAKPRVIASLPLGYADGYDRLLSNRGTVLIHGNRAPIVGNICMDQCMIDVTGVDQVKVGDEVVLFGRQGQGNLPVEEVAKSLGTISHEILCSIARRVPRVYIKNGEITKIIQYMP